MQTSSRPPIWPSCGVCSSRCHTWDHVDWLSIKVAGRLVDHHAQAKRALPGWAVDERFWLRRAALLALLDPLRAGRGDFGLFARLAAGMVDEKEFFIRKAIGWVLREVAKQRPELTYAFLSEHIERVSGLTLREGGQVPAGGAAGGAAGNATGRSYRQRR